MRTLALALATLLLALAPGPARTQPPVGVVVAGGEVRPGDVATLERPILVQGVVEGDVTSWSGPITVEGTVRGDVVSYVGTITLAPGARVGGNVLAMAGGIHGDPGAVAGAVLGDEPVAGSAFVANVATILGRQPEAADAALPRPLLSVLLALASLALCALLAAIWPARTAGAALALRQTPLRSAALGLLSTLLLALLLPPLASIMALSLVGLPLLVPLLIALQLPYLFGLAAVGRLLAAPFGGSQLHPALAACGAAAALLPVAAVGIAAPLASAALFYLVAGCGLGAAILSRGGAYAVRAQG